MQVLNRERAQRFIQSQDDFCKSTTFNQIRPFFDGESLSKRMDQIRDGIIYVRENWTRYNDFVELVHKYISEHVEDAEAKGMMEKLLETKKDWAHSSDVVDMDFGAVRLYTSVKGYDEIFSLINRVFRDVGSTADQNLIITAVFVVELINIDLFNYCLVNDRFANFTGVVYRGMAIKEDDMAAFEVLRSKEIPNRYIATPLSLLSTSVSLPEANKFIEREMLERVGSKPILMKIHVTELESKYLEYYKKRFPSSVVSTICAVDIQGLSLLPQEKEVLLRGPFFQVLDFYDGHVIRNQTCKVLEMVILNSNRDHISTMQLGQESAPARQLFGNMVAASRCKFAIRYYEEKGLENDAEDYKNLLKEKLDKLEELMNV